MKFKILNAKNLQAIVGFLVFGQIIKTVSKRDENQEHFSGPLEASITSEMQIVARALIFTLMISLGLKAQAENHLVYFGGGKSTSPSDDMFDSSLKHSLAYSKASGWKSEYHYRQSLPRDLAPDDYGKVKNDFSPQVFNDKINELTAAIKTGKIKRGEQLLVFIDTHGDLTVDGKLVGRSDAGSVDLEQLQILIRAAEEKGVKLGIIGATCYSGSLMKYRSPNTCLITTAQPDKVSFGVDARILLSARKNLGKTNLEELYLETREKTDSAEIRDNRAQPSQPMISTNAGIAADEMLSPLKKAIVHDEDRETIYRKSVCEDPALTAMKLDKSFRDVEVTIAGSFYDSQEKALPLLKEKIEEFNNLQNEFLADKSIKRSESETKKMNKRLNELSWEIARIERQAYTKAYKKISDQDKEPNPCRDFKL